MKTLVVLAVLMVLVEGYNIRLKRQVDMRGFSLYDLEDFYLAAQQQDAAHHHYINTKPAITAFYPLYDFGRRRRR